ncbi:MAG: Stp1/IreP family PP2C-type Ser/Thr phosphatase, partial [Thermodesulfobacteriota bacterium]
IGALTDVGKVRAINEDNFTAEENLGLFMVADGLGGQNAGEVASKMAIETIKSHVNDEKNSLVGDCKEEFSRDTNRMLSGIRLTNSAIYEAGQRNSEQRGMGTTISSVFINDNVMSLAHVGDSRIYRIRGEHLERLTTDHSVVGEQLKRGLITEAEAAESKYKNVITRALGAEETIEVDADEEVLLDRDKILLCTDGLTEMVGDEEILRMILSNGDDPQTACEELIDAANGKGGMDNITVILLYCEKDEQKTGLLESIFLSVNRGLRKASDAMRGVCKWKGRGASSNSGEGKGEGNV